MFDRILEWFSMGLVILAILAIILVMAIMMSVFIEWAPLPEKIIEIHITTNEYTKYYR